MKRLAAALVLIAAWGSASAWGPIGHRTVAETAALLVADDQPEGWGPLLARHRFELGVYSFFPDALFRHIDGANGAIEAPTHVLALDAGSDEPSVRGTVDRRISQFLDLARAELGPVRHPPGGYVRGGTAEGDAGRVYTGLFYLGVLAHYSGDTAVPFHATADTHGFARGQGGVHIFFESDCVNTNEPGLAADVLARARKYRARWLRDWAGTSQEPRKLVASMLADSLATVDTVCELDRRQAVIKLAPAGSKAPAERKPAAAGCRGMRPVLVDRLARASVLTAALWESVLPTGVDFSDAGSLQFSDMHLSPEYIAPR
jgi:hypothetical protein